MMARTKRMLVKSKKKLLRLIPRQINVEGHFFKKKDKKVT